jgi:hypothetical protein
LPEPEVRAVLQRCGLPAMPPTITDTEVLLGHLGSVARRSHAI